MIGHPAALLSTYRRADGVSRTICACTSSYRPRSCAMMLQKNGMTVLLDVRLNAISASRARNRTRLGVLLRARPPSMPPAVIVDRVHTGIPVVRLD